MDKRARHDCGHQLFLFQLFSHWNISLWPLLTWPNSLRRVWNICSSVESISRWQNSAFGSICRDLCVLRLGRHNSRKMSHALLSTHRTRVSRIYSIVFSKRWFSLVGRAGVKQKAFGVESCLCWGRPPPWPTKAVRSSNPHTHNSGIFAP